MNSSIILSYGDSVLRESDVSLLRGPCWLNDTIISFYFEYLSRNIYQAQNDKALFVGPEVTHCIKAAASTELQLFLDPLNAKEKEIIFFAFNDNKMYGQSGGTHWSLLVYSRLDRSMFHFDSMSGSNYRQATQVSGKILQYLSPSGKGDFEEVESLQQENGYDCGIFVLCHTEFLMKHFLKTGKIELSYQKISRDSVIHKRQDLLNLIDSLQKS